MRRVRAGRMRRSRLGAAATWCLALAGFGVYLATFGALEDAYGGVGTGVVLLLWITLFSVLYHVTPDLRRRRPESDLLADVEARTPAIPPGALADPAARARLTSVLGAQHGDLSQREAGMLDWGFTYGIAWAVARRQDATAPEEVVGRRALHAAHAAYQAHRRAHGAGSAPDPHANGRRRPDPADLRAQPQDARAARQPHAS